MNVNLLFLGKWLNEQKPIVSEQASLQKEHAPHIN
jgi:hypothetical protein